MSVHPRLVKMSLRAVLHLGTLAAALTVTAVQPGAQARPWPNFSLTRVTDGQAVESASLVRADQWVVVVVRARCESCMSLVRRLAADAPGRDAGRIVVVLSGMQAADVAAFRAAAPALPPQAWHLDPTGASSAALGAQGVPLVVGVRGGQVAWSLSGAMYIDAQWPGVVVPWLR
jgi:hypothetical protein